MISTHKTRAAFTACGIAMATLGFSAHAAEPDVPAPPAPPEKFG